MDKLINGTFATIKKLDRVGNDIYGYPKGRVYLKCDDESAGRTYKDSRLIQELKECVPKYQKEVSFMLVFWKYFLFCCKLIMK